MDMAKLSQIITMADDGGMTLDIPALARWTEQTLGLICVWHVVYGPLIYRYQGGRYLRCTDEFLLGYMKKAVSTAFEGLLTLKSIKEALGLIYASTNYIPFAELNQKEGHISFQNGILSLSSAELILVEPRPDIYFTIQMPCAWSGASEPTPLFDAYLNSLADGDSEVTQFLLQWIGLCLSNIPGWRAKTALFMVGAGDAGAQLRRFVERLLGTKNCAGVDIVELESKAGIRSLYGKRLAGSSAMGTNCLKELRMFQRIIGGDGLDTGKGEMFRYNGLLWFCCNQFPELRYKQDHQAIGKIVILNCHEVPTDDIGEELYRERAGIIFKAVNALQEVIANGYQLSEPECVFRTRERYLGYSNTVIRFFTECMTHRPNRRITAKDETTGQIYRTYLTWCRRVGCPIEVNESQFREILSRYLRCPYKSLVKRQKGNSYFIDYTLTSVARDTYVENVS